MLRGSVRFSAATFEVAWEYLRLGDLPTALFVPSTGATLGEREKVVRAAIDELGKLGLIAGRDEVDDDLADALRLLARPVDEFYGWFRRANGSVVSGLAAVARQRALLAVLDNGKVWISPVDPGAPVHALIGVAPKVRPVHAKSITVPANEFRIAGPEPGRGRHQEDFEANRSLLQGGTSSSGDVEVEKLRALVAQPDQGRAQLFAAIRERGGRRRKSERPVYYLDSADGRWLLHFTAQRGGEPWLTAAPGSPDALAQALFDARHELLGQV